METQIIIYCMLHFTHMNLLKLLGIKSIDITVAFIGDVKNFKFFQNWTLLILKSVNRHKYYLSYLNASFRFIGFYTSLWACEWAGEPSAGRLRLCEWGIMMVQLRPSAVLICLSVLRVRAVEGCEKWAVC